MPLDAKEAILIEREGSNQQSPHVVSILGVVWSVLYGACIIRMSIAIVHVVFVESGDGSAASDFEPMIKAGSGQVLSVRRRSTLQGNTDSHYYVVSVW